MFLTGTAGDIKKQLDAVNVGDYISVRIIAVLESKANDVAKTLLVKVSTPNGDG